MFTIDAAATRDQIRCTTPFTATNSFKRLRSGSAVRACPYDTSPESAQNVTESGHRLGTEFHAGISVTPALTTCRSLRRNSAVWTSPSSVLSGLPMVRPTAFQSISGRGGRSVRGSRGHRSGTALSDRPSRPAPLVPSEAIRETFRCPVY
jgi:hypothetical protein